LQPDIKGKDQAVLDSDSGFAATDKSTSYLLIINKPQGFCRKKTGKKSRPSDWAGFFNLADDYFLSGDQFV
jgi:hypothetical protein